MSYTIDIKTVNFDSDGNATEYVDIETSTVDDYLELSGEAYTGSGSVKGYLLSKQAIADSSYDGDYYAVIIDDNNELDGLYSNFEIDAPYDWIDVDTSTNPIKIFIYDNSTDEERDGYVKIIHNASEYCYTILYIIQEADERTISVSDDAFIVDRFSKNDNEINVTVGGGNKKYYVKSINKYKASGRQVKYDNAIILSSSGDDSSDDSSSNDGICEDDNGNYVYPLNIKTYGDINTECYYYKIILAHANKRSVTATITLWFGSDTCDSTDSVYTIPDIPKYGSMVIFNLTNITAKIDGTTVSRIYYVDYNDSVDIALTASEGYTLPVSVTFTYTSSNVQTTYSSTNGTITITNIDCAVTVTAVAVADTVTITFDLSALYATLEDEDSVILEDDDTYEIEKDTTATFYLGRYDSCHSLPDSISVTLTDNDDGNSSTISYSYIKSSGKVILNNVSDNITISAKGVAKEMSIEFVLTNITTDYDGNTYWCNEDIVFTLYASDGYELPDSITVAIGSSTYNITSDSDIEDSDSGYELNYDKNNGKATIYGAYKNVVVTAVAEEESLYTVTVDCTYCTADITSQEVSYGSSVAITFTEEDGYTLSESGIAISGAYDSNSYEDNTLTITNIQSDIVITAVAEEDIYYFESSVYYLSASYDGIYSNAILIGVNGVSDVLSNQNETTITNSSSDSIYAYWIFTSTVSINLYGYRTEDEYNNALEIVTNIENSDNTGFGLVSDYVTGGSDIEYTVRTTVQLTDSYDATKFGWYIAIVSFTTVDDESITYYTITINSSNCEIIITSTEAVAEDSIPVEEGGSVTLTVIPNDGYEFTKCIALTDSNLSTDSTDTTTSSFELDYDTDDNTITISDIYCNITLTVTCSVITHTITLDLTNCAELNNETSFTVNDGDSVEFYVGTNSSKYDLPSTIKVMDATKTYSLTEDSYMWDSSRGYFYMSNITSDYVVVIEATT